MAKKFDGFTCKDCANFIREGERRSGTCKVRKYPRSKNGREITNTPFVCTFSKVACLDFAKRADELKDKESPKTYAELQAENVTLYKAFEWALDRGDDVCGKCAYYIPPRPDEDYTDCGHYGECVKGIVEYFKKNG